MDILSLFIYLLFVLDHLTCIKKECDNSGESNRKSLFQGS